MSNPDVITRRCYACQEIKPIEDFSKDKKKLFGRSYCCKPCLVKRTRKWADEHPEKMRDYFRTYEERHRAERRVRHRKDLAAHAAKGRRYRKNHPVKMRVRYALNGAVRRKEMIKPAKCQNCGAEGKIQAHHHKGYAWKNRLEVQWLCTRCHGLAHRLDKGRDGLASSSHVA